MKTSLEAGMPITVLIDPSYIYGGIVGFGHFVVVVGIENGEILYHDPGIPEGKFRRCEIERFLKAWGIFKNWMVTCKRKYQN